MYPLCDKISLLGLLLCFSTCSGVFTPAYAQPAGGGGFFQERDIPSLSDRQRENIINQIDQNVTALMAAGKLSNLVQTSAVQLDWPLKPAASLTDAGYHGMGSFVDHDPNYPDQLLDYNCGARTYDWDSGYNHRGTDFFSWPFAWYKMDHDHVEIVAAEEGVIVLKQDGYYDRRCGLTEEPWNAVFVRHADGSVAWYGHLKKGSLTPVEIGETVHKGDYLGIMGSSGNSYGPHLHFELYDVNEELIDPFFGTCNSLNGETWWAQQPDYYDSAVNAIKTHAAPPVFPDCPNTEILNLKDHFEAGDLVYLAVYYRDQLAGQPSAYRVAGPDGTVSWSWLHESSEPHYSASYWYWLRYLPSDAQAGTWTFEVTYEGVTYTHTFTVGNPATSVETISAVPDGYELSAAYPNPFNPSTRFTLKVSTTQKVILTVYDLLGRPVSILHDGLLTSNETYTFEIDASDLMSGLYSVHATGEWFSANQTIMLVK